MMDRPPKYYPYISKNFTGRHLRDNSRFFGRFSEFDTASAGVTFDLGDTLGVYPNNDKTEVREFLDAYGVDPDLVLSLEYVFDGKDFLPPALTAEQLFSEVQWVVASFCLGRVRVCVA
jgi:sulfite reductase alpha subunit-like flavoprotein